MKVIYLKESLKERGLGTSGKKADMKLRLQQEVAAGVKIISEEVTEQPHNQMEGLHHAAHWEELKNMDKPVYYPDNNEYSRAPTVPEGEGNHRK